jgi:hypothetical protein
MTHTRMVIMGHGTPVPARFSTNDVEIFDGLPGALDSHEVVFEH